MNDSELCFIEEQLNTCIERGQTFGLESMAKKHIPELIAEIRRLNKKEATQDETEI